MVWDGAIPSCCTSVLSPTWTLTCSDNNGNHNDDEGGGSGGGSALTTGTSWAILAHAWLSASLTDAFASPSHRRDNGGGGNNNERDEVGRRPK